MLIKYPHQVVGDQPAPSKAHEPGLLKLLNLRSSGRRFGGGRGDFRLSKALDLRLFQSTLW